MGAMLKEKPKAVFLKPYLYMQLESGQDIQVHEDILIEALNKDDCCIVSEAYYDSAVKDARSLIVAFDKLYEYQKETNEQVREVLKNEIKEALSKSATFAKNNYFNS